MKHLEIAEDASIKITYGALVVILGGMLGFAAWMTTMQVNAQNNKVEVENLKDDLTVELTKINSKLESLPSIDKRLYRIEILIDDNKK